MNIARFEPISIRICVYVENVILRNDKQIISYVNSSALAGRTNFKATILSDVKMVKKQNFLFPKLLALSADKFLFQKFIKNCQHIETLEAFVISTSHGGPR